MFITPNDLGENMGSTSVITLGTAGGPRWWTPVEADSRFGISTAVVVGGRSYLVDLGIGAGRQFARAGLSMDTLGGVFITHLHSDHTTDLANLALFGMFGLTGEQPPIPVIGPGDRGVTPPSPPVPAWPPPPSPRTCRRPAPQTCSGC